MEKNKMTAKKIKTPQNKEAKDFLQIINIFKNLRKKKKKKRKLKSIK